MRTMGSFCMIRVFMGGRWYSLRMLDIRDC